MTLTLSFGCGKPAEKKDTRSLAQISDELPGDGYFLCRQDFSYAYNDRGDETAEFFAVAGTGRKTLKKQILEACLDHPFPAYREACSDSSALKAVACIHETLLAPIIKPDSATSMKCTLAYPYVYSNQTLEGFSGELVSAAESTDPLAHVRSIVEQCLALKGPERDGCSRQLLKGELKCATSE